MYGRKALILAGIAVIIVAAVHLVIITTSGSDILQKASFADLNGWQDDKITESLPAFKKSCEKLDGTWADVCSKINEFSGSDDELRKLLEENLTLFKVVAPDEAEGLFTGYYEAELKGSRTKTAEFKIPLHGFPSDMVEVDLRTFGYDVPKPKFFAMVKDGKLVPYTSRREIEEGANAPVLLWVNDAVDLFILHIQGSGRVKLADGEYIKVGYAANNEHPFVGIGSIMKNKGLLEKGKSGMPEIKKWLKEHPKEAQKLMLENPRYIFFKINEQEGAVGSLGVPLTPQRSLAVDTKYIKLGIPLWLETNDADGNKIRRLMLAQDTGKAIKGAVRGDFYWGFGDAAFNQAGRMKAAGNYFVLLPKGKENGAE